MRGKRGKITKEEIENMAKKKIKFALKLKEGVEARNLQELREAFDLNQIVAYFLDGKLETWLLDRYYEDLAEKINDLDKSDPELRRKLCEIFEVEYEEDALSIEEIEERNHRIRKLKEVTDDDDIIKNVDKVAFCQEELADLLDEGQKTIYLCGTDFHIPASKRGIRYIGVETKLDITKEEIKKYQANDIELIDLLEGYFDEFKEEVHERMEEYGYNESSNPLAGYAISNNAPLTVNESAAPYASVPSPTSPVMNRPADTLPVQEDFGVFAPDKAESIDLPGITITLNGEKRFLSNECYPYNMWRIHKIWMNDVDSGKIILPEKQKDKMTMTINGHDVSNNAFAFMHDKNNIVYKVEPAE